MKAPISILLASILLPFVLAEEDVSQNHDPIPEATVPSQRPSSLNEETELHRIQRTEVDDHSAPLTNSDISESPQPTSLSQQMEDETNEVDEDDDELVCSPLVWSPDLAMVDDLMLSEANSEEGNIVIIPFRPQSRQCPAGNDTKSSRMRKTINSNQKLEESDSSDNYLSSAEQTEPSTLDDTAIQLDQEDESIQSTNETLSTEDSSDEEADTTTMSMVVDYASKSAGALVIEKSSGWKGTSSLLMSDNDRYALVPTNENPKYVIIALSEEINVKQVVLSNYERYSANVKQFQVWGSQTMDQWASFGEFTANVGSGKQTFELTQSNNNWARYLKFKFLDHYFEDEHYLTITQISVHGTTMQQGFQEHWDQQDEEDDEDEIMENVDIVELSKVNGNDGAMISEDTTGKMEQPESLAGDSIAEEVKQDQKPTDPKASDTGSTNTESSQSTTLSPTIDDTSVDVKTSSPIETPEQNSSANNTTSNHSQSPGATDHTSPTLDESVAEEGSTEPFANDADAAKTKVDIAVCDGHSIKSDEVDKNALQSIFKVSDDPRCHCVNENGYLDGAISKCLQASCPKDVTLQGRGSAVLASASLTKHYESHIRSLNRWSIQAKELEPRHAARSKEALRIFTKQNKDQSDAVNQIGLSLSKCEVPMVQKLAIDLNSEIQKHREMTKTRVQETAAETSINSYIELSETSAQVEDQPTEKKNNSGNVQPSSTKLESEIMTNAAVMETLHTLSMHFPSSTCLVDLSKNLQQLHQNNKHKAAQPRQQGGGNGNMGPSGTSGGMEPIFKKLTDEIKALQSTVHTHEKLAKELIICFQQVLADVLAEQERNRISQEDRLERLEQMMMEHQKSAANSAVEALRSMIEYILSLDWDKLLRQVMQEALRAADDAKELAHSASSVLGPMGNSLGFLLLTCLCMALLLFRYRVRPSLIRKASC